MSTLRNVNKPIYKIHLGLRAPDERLNFMVTFIHPYDGNIFISKDILIVTHSRVQAFNSKFAFSFQLIITAIDSEVTQTQ